jgi:predicted ATPase
VLVDLAAVRDPDLVVDALARGVGVTLEGGDHLATLQRHRRARQLLILVDNCEHVVEPVAALVAGRCRGPVPSRASTWSRPKTG